MFYTVGGKEVPVPEQEANLGSPGAVLSPDGKLVTGGFAGQSGQIVSEVLDARTGKRAALVPGQELLAWADNHWLIAWRCNPKQCDPGKGEFRNQLVLASLDGKTVTPLSGFRNADLHYSGRWTPILTTADRLSNAHRVPAARRRGLGPTLQHDTTTGTGTPDRTSSGSAVRVQGRRQAGTHAVQGCPLILS